MSDLAGIAQLVEQRTENPRVGGSSPPPGIFIYLEDFNIKSFWPCAIEQIKTNRH